MKKSSFFDLNMSAKNMDNSMKFKNKRKAFSKTKFGNNMGTKYVYIIYIGIVWYFGWFDVV